MATIEDFENWLSELSQFSRLDDHIEIVRKDINRLSVNIYTNTNRYRITANQQGEADYLGCTANSRKSRAGEDWTRGSDLPDGALNRKTWERIIAGIVSYEMVRIHKISVKIGSQVDEVPTTAAEKTDPNILPV